MEEGKEYVGLWGVFGEDTLEVTWRPAGCRLVGVVPLMTMEARDVEPEPLGSCPLRWVDCGGIEDECLTGEVGGE